MSNRIFAYSVILDNEYKDEDAECIISAIRMIKGVADVTEHTADPTLYFAKTNAMLDMRSKLMGVLYPKEI